LLTFVIIGGGPTGVEMAGAVIELARNSLAGEFRAIDPRQARVILVEAGPRLLAAFPENLSDYARRSLEATGVEVMTQTMVTKCDDLGVETAGGRIESSTLIWAAGVIASPAATWIGAEHDRAGRIRVEPNLAVGGHPEIFAIGDTAAVSDMHGRPVPGIAPAAKQMGRYVGNLIAARVSGGRELKPFVYRHQGDLATIGRKAAVVNLGRFQLKGFLGWLFWGLVHIYFLIGIRNRIAVAFKWIWDYATYQRGVRLITAQSPAASPDRERH
jgi:NADH dehydrogenase